MKALLSYADQHPADHFIFFTVDDVPFKTDSPNIEWNQLGSLKKTFWFNKNLMQYKLLKKLKALKCDRLIQIDGFISCPDIPQLILSPNLQWLIAHELKKNEESRIVQYLSSCARAAEKVIVGSLFERELLLAQQVCTDEKVEVVPPIPDFSLSAISIEEKEDIKSEFTEGQEYFIYHGIVNAGAHLMNLLKAFSVFKKRQRSKMKLVISGCKSGDFVALENKLSSYRFQSDVIMMKDLDQKMHWKITSAAYAAIFPYNHQQDTPFLWECIQLQVPVIAEKSGIVASVVSEHALYYPENNFQSMGETLMWIFKDENMRSQIIEGMRNIDNSIQVAAKDRLEQLLQSLTFTSTS